jgi:hypothetical protein
MGFPNGASLFDKTRVLNETTKTTIANKTIVV